ncbi:MAG: DUF1566 domain-containing protein [Deltaproteobacteria bacterium]|nr:DUF1566 domain-containing protein [Deltaproteobacteria bacterium]
MTGIKTKIIFIMAVWVFFLSAPVLAGDRFTDNGDGTVTDHQLGVMWAKTDNQGNINWNDANQWVEFTFPYTIEKQYDDWRLPTLAELKSLYVYVPDKAYKGYETDCGQRIKIVPDIKLSCGWVWTSERSAIQAAIFNFNRGYHYMARIGHYKSYRVLPVRDLK